MTTVVGGTAREIGEAPRRRHFSLPRSLATHASVVAWDTSHLDKSELKAAASRNVSDSVVTLETTHLDKSELKAAALKNVEDSEMTWDTSHLDKSELKAAAL